MTRQEAKLVRFTTGARTMGAGERDAVRAALRAAEGLRGKGDRRRMLEAVTEIGAAKGRDMQRRESDAQTDAKRRRLVGARLPLGEAQRCKDCAARLGLSLYGFVSGALEQACRRVEAGPEGVMACPLAGGGQAESAP